MTSQEESIKITERELAKKELLINQFSDLVDEGAVCSSFKSAKKIFIKMGRLLGMVMNDVIEEIEDMEDEEELDDERY